MNTVYLGEAILEPWGCLLWAPPWDPPLSTTPVFGLKGHNPQRICLGSLWFILVQLGVRVLTVMDLRSDWRFSLQLELFMISYCAETVKYFKFS